MLEQAIKDQLKTVFGNLKSNFTFTVNVADNHSQKKELIELLNDVASCSDKLSVEENNGTYLAFSIKKENEPLNIYFRAVPTGHEFSSLLAAILNADGIGKNLPDDLISAKIKSLKGPIELKSYISLTCTNCPEVVQALNVMALLNPNITHTIIDGAINQSEVDELKIQAVPTVFANGELLHVGRSSLGELINKIENIAGTENTTDSVTVNKEYDVAVVGGGPAGVSAAIYSARKGFSVALIAEKVGGQVTETVSIENMISVPQTTGSKLSGDLMTHLKEYPIDILENRLVEKVDIVDGYKQLKTTLGEIITTPAMIIATGASWRKLGVPGEDQYIGSGVAFCTHCDGPFYKNKKVVVIGGGNSGLEAAIDLSSIASEVTVFEFMDELKGDQVLQDKLKTKSNVKILTGIETKDIEGDGSKVTGIQYKVRSTGEENTLAVDGVFVQIGLKPNSQVFSEVVNTNRMGEIEIDAACRTSKPGIYAAGDVSVVPYKQIVVAMGEGSKAALSAFEDNIKNLQLAN